MAIQSGGLLPGCGGTLNMRRCSKSGAGDASFDQFLSERNIANPNRIKNRANPASVPAQLSLLDLAAPCVTHSLKDEGDFITELSAMVPHPIEVKLTHNRSSLISVVPEKDGSLIARFQHAFRAADPRTMKSLARFTYRPDKRSKKRIDDFIEEHSELFEAMAREAYTSRNLVAAGKSHNLKKLLKKVMGKHGIRLPGTKISWSNRGTRCRNRYSIKFGSFCQDTRTISVHPDLDRPEVPDYFVEYIIYHELCHALFLPVGGDGQRVEFHTEEFTRFEKKFYRYEEAIEFEEWFMDNLL